MDDDKRMQRENNAKKNAENVKNAADVAIASKNPYATAAGAAVKAADAITGGKASGAVGKGMEQAGRLAGPLGKKLQNDLNRVHDSGLGDRAGEAARIFGGPRKEGIKRGSDLAKEPTGNNMDTIGRGRDEPSSSLNYANVNQSESTEQEEQKPPRIAGIGAFGKQPGDRRTKEDNNDDDNNNNQTENSLFGSKEAKQMALLLFPSVLFILFIIFIYVTISSVTDIGFGDALGASFASGEDMGLADSYDGTDGEEQQYYERINNVKLSFQAQGRTFDSLDVASVFHVLMSYGADIDYKDLTEARITEVADALFDGNYYDKEKFKEELKTRIIPRYLPGKSPEEIEEIVAEIDQYVSDFNDYVERSVASSSNYYGVCSTGSTCEYNIKGFYINSKNISKPMNIKNLKVRLMQCGSPYGNGNDNTPIKQDLVSFEDYVGGVAYGELGDGYPIEAYKAQLVMARSYALARPTAMGNAAGKRLAQENGQWVLQIAACVSDQVFCDVDKGCSYMGGGDGQGGWIASGTNVSGAVRTRGPLAGNSVLRQAMAATQGEVLVNNQGNIVSTGFNSTRQKAIIDGASKGQDYKQLLLKNYSGATNIEKASCQSQQNCSGSTGEFANWKQCGATWSSVKMGTGGENICSVGCLVTSLSILIAKSGVQTTLPNFNPGAFVEYLNAHGGFANGANLSRWDITSEVAPKFIHQGTLELAGNSKDVKFNKIKEKSDAGYYLICEVKGNTGQHWVAVDKVNGNQILMMDPGSTATNMWAEYPWSNTSLCHMYKAG